MCIYAVLLVLAFAPEMFAQQTSNKESTGKFALNQQPKILRRRYEAMRKMLDNKTTEFSAELDQEVEGLRNSLTLFGLRDEAMHLEQQRIRLAKPYYTKIANTATNPEARLAARIALAELALFALDDPAQARIYLAPVLNQDNFERMLKAAQDLLKHIVEFEEEQKQQAQSGENKK
jgi:hypothetical protein